MEADGFPDSICLHCHQTVEKALKGILIHWGKAYPFVHDLVKLADLCRQEDKMFEECMEMCDRLNPLYAEQRYPFIDQEAYSDEELKGYIAAAEKIYQLVKGKIHA